jgi:hypothetical protein
VNERPVLVTEADFWRHVQGPSTRVKERSVLADLAVEALAQFSNPYVRASAVVVLLYRAAEPGGPRPLPDEALSEKVSETLDVLRPTAGFNDCRWFISLQLATSAWRMARLGNR